MGYKNSYAFSEAFDQFGTDPLYRRLCSTQKCFRARLTPKPWRCGSRKPSQRWPWSNARAEAAFQEWERRYLATARNYATCRLLEHCGNHRIHPDLAPLLEFHDLTSRCDSSLPLA